MGTLNVKIPDEMEADIESYLDANPHFMNKSELVRDALRHRLAADDAITGPAPSDDDPLFTAPAMEVADPVDEAEIDDVLYGRQSE